MQSRETHRQPGSPSVHERAEAGSPGRDMARTLDEMREAADEQALVRRARGGDRGAFDELVRLHFARVYAFLHRMIGSHEDAEDLAQECFVRAWRSLALYRAEASFATWLHRIALHLAQDHRRGGARRSRIVPLEDSGHGTSEVGSRRVAGTAGTPPVFAPEPSPAETASRNELARELPHALSRLPPRLRAALVLRALEGRGYPEVAEITGVEPATARAHVMQARRLLLRWLAPWLPREPPERSR